MILYPAIDILGGTVVRLLRGDYDQVTDYERAPATVGTEFARQGAAALHVVDLDGARAGRPCNLAAVAELAESVEIPVQLGGGLRSLEAVELAIGAGVDRVVLGTSALTDRSLLESVLERFGPDRLVVSVDHRGDRVATEGWVETGQLSPEALVEGLVAIGVGRFLCTKIETDGTMEGPDLEALNRIAAATRAKLIASGGVGSLEDLELLKEGAEPNVEGVIVGRALYEDRFTVAEAVGVLANR